MKSSLTLLLSLCFLMTTLTAAAKDDRCYEMRIYYAPPGKLEDLNARFRNHTLRLFEKHGMQNIGYWVPIENPDNKLIYILAYPSREARDKSWKSFMADPDWQKAWKESEVNGKLVAKAESIFLEATDYSPEIKVSKSSEPRTFELRTYTASDGNLNALNDRFRNHTVALFKKHGMSNIGYWVKAKDQPDADKTLIYILAHGSKEAAAQSFKGFREDPDWVTARKASEEKAGGSLTARDGVKSVFMKATDYSPMK
ncbi:MAG: NIPSNAP family protein [Verrucomicrobiota bacterium]